MPESRKNRMAESTIYRRRTVANDMAAAPDGIERPFESGYNLALSRIRDVVKGLGHATP